MGCRAMYGVLLSILLWASVQCGKEDKLYFIEISFPPMLGRNETDDVYAMKQLLYNTTGVKSTYALKELGNSIVVAVVEIENDGTWASVTRALALRGYKYSAIPLYRCEDFARAMNVTLNPQTQEFDNVTIYLADLVFYAEDTMFRVYICGEYETSKRCHLNGAYNLLVKDTSLCLCDLASNRVLYEWPYNFIRRYGKTHSSFHFEAGRKCSTGEGEFVVKTNQGPEIFRAVTGTRKTPTERVQTRGCEGIQSPDKAGLKDEEQRVVGAAEKSHTYVNITGARQGFLDEKEAGATVGVYSEPYSTDTGETYLTAVAEKQQYSRDALDGSLAGHLPKSDVEHIYSEPYTS